MTIREIKTLIEGMPDDARITITDNKYDLNLFSVKLYIAGLIVWICLSIVMLIRVLVK